MYLLLLLLPLFGSISAGFFGRFLGSRGSVIFTIAFLLSTFFLSVIAFYEVALSGCICSIKVSDWFSCEMFDTSWGFYFDSLTVVMLIVITSVSSLVHIYSMSYMSEDPHLPRFMSYLSIFTFFMLMLVVSDNLLVMFFGWEGVGLASYLLINFWFTRLSANKASIKAMLLNRVGDFGLALGIMSIFSVFKTLSFPVIFSLAPSMVNEKMMFLNQSFHALTVISLCLFVGAIGKSAQLGLHTWLPDAMEGPTPVSALIHAATMVTAGVFMIARCSPLFEFAEDTLTVIALLGAMTCFFAATTAVVQNDLKRVIAYSTASQLGYMVFACGVSNYEVALFHLMNHAFFKALLFLGAGSVIHALSNQQDMRKMGALVQSLPFTYAMMLIGSLSLAGFPFLTGFYSKDVILEVAFARYTINGNFAYWLGGICVLLTSYYSFRLCFLTFFTESKAIKKPIENSHDAPIIMAIPLMILAIGSIFLGYCGKDMMIGVGTQFWGNAIFTLPEKSNILESHYIPQSVKIIPFIFTMLGIFLAFYFNEHKFLRKKAFAFKISPIGLFFYEMLNRRWFFDKVYNDIFAQKALDFGYNVSFKRLDKGSFEILGPQGIVFVFSKATREISELQSGMIYHYAFVMVIGLTTFITSVTLWDFLENLIDSRLYFLFLIYFFLSTVAVKDSALLLRELREPTVQLSK
uniref:NADH-ubiquinone oxidoreductase chain 5 n=1 Tax=Jaagichlorella roystonensis TaxID=1052852 RepID=A0A6C0M8V8_9CHLO|nr:NADH dehydrogenase subunit 5 [Jaagichlorella roystonensis]QHU78337.1 NADH dehydrogenase subunit 5 [Jaagichlorella roystonensis]